MSTSEPNTKSSATTSQTKGAASNSANAWTPNKRLHRSRSLIVLEDLPTEYAEEGGVLSDFVLSVQEVWYTITDIYKSINISDSQLAKFTIRPGSKAHRIVYILLAFAILLECYLIPYRAVWGFESWKPLPAWLALDYAMDAIFIIDIFTNFVTTYAQEGTGKIITNRKLIARRYIRSDFILHFVASAPLDFFALWYGLNSLPWFRLNRLLRATQLIPIFAALEKSFGSHIIRILRLFFLMILFAHWFGCGWFFLALMEGESEKTWASVANLWDEDSFTQYITSAYWALVVMTTVGFGDIVPVTNWEKIFTIITMITGVSIYATIFGNMATLIAQLDASATRYREKLDSLHEYMKYRNLPSYLRNRILNYYEVIWSRHKGIDESLILNELPSSLRSEIALYLNRELVENVPLFKGSNEPGFINSLVVMLKPQVALEGDYIIRHGEIGREMYFISRGEVEVVSGDGKTVFAVLKEGSYFGEIALLFAARRIASIRAIGYCELLMLTKEDFDSVLNFFPSFADSMRAIAKQKIEEERKKREAEAQSQANAQAQKQAEAQNGGDGNQSVQSGSSGNNRSAQSLKPQAQDGTQAQSRVTSRSASHASSHTRTHNSLDKQIASAEMEENAKEEKLKAKDGQKMGGSTRVQGRDDEKSQTPKMASLGHKSLSKETEGSKSSSNIRRSTRNLTTEATGSTGMSPSRSQSKLHRDHSSSLGPDGTQSSPKMESHKVHASRADELQHAAIIRNASRTKLGSSRSGLIKQQSKPDVEEQHEKHPSTDSSLSIGPRHDTATLQPGTFTKTPSGVGISIEAPADCDDVQLEGGETRAAADLLASAVTPRASVLVIPSSGPVINIDSQTSSPNASRRTLDASPSDRDLSSPMDAHHLADDDYSVHSLSTYSSSAPHDPFSVRASVRTCSSLSSRRRESAYAPLTNSHTDLRPDTNVDLLQDANVDLRPNTNGDPPQDANVDLRPNTNGDPPQDANVDLRPNTNGDPPQDTNGDPPQGAD
eukprot:TRINITY_DN5567_c0_g2_i5.p1 TRINITY_DN5567_c0_g2~~TRINITY_DN5567_c0_g2_i5.p1  ORF type:complete len:1014 (+),score=197.73 TRINITY_DN5567_c0_g2_i5:27-3044(+)